MSQTTSQERLCLVCVGLSHHTATIDVRERLAFRPQQIAHALKLLQQDGIEHAVVVSTCNRVEIYTATTDVLHVQQKLLHFLARYHNMAASTLQQLLYQLQAEAALQHLFCVAASLDSMAVGEPQILGQLKQAYAQAHQAGAVDSYLHRVFARAFCVSKSVRTQTQIGQHAVRLGSAAVQLAKDSLGHLTKRRVLLLGAGKVSSLVAPYLQREGVQLHILNRCETAAQMLAKRHNAQPHSLQQLCNLLTHADVVVSSASCSGNMITANMLQQARAHRHSRTPLLVIDLSVPRSVEPQVAACQQTQLYNLDHVHAQLQQANSTRRQEALQARLLIQQEVQRFAAYTRQQQVVPLVKKLRQDATGLAQQEAERLIRSLGPLSPCQRHKIEITMQRAINKLLHKPITQLKSLAGQEDQQAQDKLQTIYSLFDESFDL
ncbi:MAG: glutamyl-tRNA reductase [Myxococcota bacterium]